MGNKDRLFTYLKPMRARLVFATIFAFAFVAAQVAQPVCLGLALDAAGSTTLTDVADPDKFYACLITAIVLIVVGVICAYFFEVMIMNISQKVIKNIRDDVYRKINAISLKDFDKKAHGDLVLLEIRDMENVAAGLFAIFKTLIQGIFTIIITIVMMFMVNWILAIAIIALTPISVIMAKFVSKFSHKHYKKQSELQAKISSISLETLNNIDLVQSLNNEEEAVKKFDESNANLKKEGVVAQFSASWVNPSTRLVNNTIYVIIGVLGVIMMFYRNDFAGVYAALYVGGLSMFLSYTNQYSKPFNEISNVTAEYESAKASFRRINDFLNLDNDIDSGDSLINDIETIEFKDVSFSYNEKQKLIEHFNLSIKKGQKVAIVGPTGAGKTTLINLLMRFYEPTKGEILVNGQSYPLIAKQSLRRNIGMVLQDTWIFSGTIADNIRYFKKDATEDEIMEAARKAHADVFINNLPEAYLTCVSNRSGLSEGQRQMIAIARVMLLNPQLVILDEATSNIDTRSEKLITEAFDQIMQEKTSIVIAHRLSTIEGADIILVMKDGAIVETGNHKELMNKQGFYYSLYSSQYK